MKLLIMQRSSASCYVQILYSAPVLTRPQYTFHDLGQYFAAGTHACRQSSSFRPNRLHSDSPRRRRGRCECRTRGYT